MTKYKSILFSTLMVKAILEGRKTQTRRLIKPQPIEFPKPVGMGYWSEFPDSLKHPYIKSKYQIGDILYVREKFKKNSISMGWSYHYYANNDTFTDPDNEKWKPSIHMPKDAARIFLEVTDLKAERLQDISEEDAEAEGVKSPCYYEGDHIYELGKGVVNFYNASYKIGFEALWQSIYGTWEENPYVFVYSFKQIDKPENFI